MANNNTEGVDRRDFLRRLLGLASVTVAVAADRPGQAEEDKPVEKTRRGYRESEHVRHYYRCARF